MKQLRYAIMWMAALWFSVKVQAQSGGLIVQRDASGLFLYHTVAPKENFYSIGRLFNISPKIIAPFNGLQLAGGLSIGQKIKIPLQEQNFTVAKTKVPGEVLVPVYREAADKKLVAGFLRVVKGQSPLAGGGPAVSAPAVATAPAVRTAAPVIPPAGTSETASAPPAPVKTAPIAKPVPVKVQTTTTPDPPPAPVAAVTTTGTARYSGEGLFHPDYLSQTDNGRKIRSASGLAGAFKSTSGWDNGKFYALMNNVDRGTVVKVTNLSNNKVVFVKVLGDIADIRQNTGMVIVVSDAAVAQLGVTSDRFTSELSYSK
jgi:hypothetical protein